MLVPILSFNGGFMSAPVIDEPLRGKWEDMLDWPETRDRVMVQNYESGRIKLVKPNQISMMTGSIKYDGKLTPPVWRQVSADEAKDLWRAEVYLQYCRHIAIWAQHEWAKQDQAVENNGGSVKNINLLTDSKRRAKALKANSAMQKRDRAEKRVDQYAKYGGLIYFERNDKHQAETDSTLAKYLRESVKKHREQRDIDIVQVKEREIFQQEELRERAREQVRKSKSGKMGPTNK